MAGEPLLTSPAAPAIFASFRAFWREVEAARTRAVAGDPQTAGTSTGQWSGETGLMHPAAVVQGRLLEVLQTQLADVSRSTQGAALQAYRDAHYLMAAMADEVFVKLSWAGASWWLWNPLEAALFGTRCAGQRVFERIEQLTASGDPTQRELAAVYLVALSLGFEGQYAGEADRAWLDRYRQKLRRFIFGDETHLEGPLAPQCYAHTEGTGAGARLQSARPWLWAALLVIALWLAVSTVVWRQSTAPVAASVRRVGAALTTGSAGSGGTGGQP